jgi:MFS family permease
LHVSDEVQWYRNAPLRLLVTGSFFNSVAFFAALPFLALYLSDISSLSPAAIGAVVGAVALIGAFGGFAGGMLGDRFGAVTLIRVGLVIYVGTYALLATTSQLAVVIVLVLMLGVGRVLVEPSMKKLMSLAAAGTQGGVFRIRYVTLCLGAIVGPPIGAGLYAVSKSLMFVLPALVFAVVLMLMAVHAGPLRQLDRPMTREPSSSWREALSDRALMLTVGAGVVIFFVFSQFESILPLFMKAELGSSAIGHFSVLLVINAALGIAVQFPAERMSGRVSDSAVALGGCVAFAAALLLFAAVPAGLGFLYAAVVLWTVGEALLLPMPDMLIHKLTPDHSKGSYFGLAELRYVGFFLGPVVGGALLTQNTSLYFGAMAVLIFAAWPLLSRVATSGVIGAVAMPSPAVAPVAAEPDHTGSRA